MLGPAAAGILEVLWPSIAITTLKEMGNGEGIVVILDLDAACSWACANASQLPRFLAVPDCQEAELRAFQLDRRLHGLPFVC